MLQSVIGTGETNVNHFSCQSYFTGEHHFFSVIQKVIF